MFKDKTHAVDCSCSKCVIKKEEIRYCQTQGGTYRAYLPEYFDSVAEEWKPIPLSKHAKKTEGIHVPQPYDFGGINNTISLYGYNQAKAFAHMFAAIHDSEFSLKKALNVRIQPYEVHYEIKARKLPIECVDENQEPMDENQE